MDRKEVERTVIAKPIASRPSSSTFRSFTELLAGAISAEPSNTSAETAVPAIRPKTVRFKPLVHCAATGLISSQAEISDAAVCNPSDTIAYGKSTVVYKPLAKPVSKTTISLLAKMGSFNKSHQPTNSLVESKIQQYLHQDKHSFVSNLSSSVNQNLPSRTETNQTAEASKMVSTLEDHEVDIRSLPSMVSGDRPSYDGYSWRKYGQKQVKGSEFPRSYYKCTHPNCPVKKKVERSFDGQIAEIVYKGEHNHSKPQAPKRGSCGPQGLGMVSDTAGQDVNNQLSNSQLNERNEGSEGRIDNQNESGLSLHSYQSYKASQPYDSLATPADNSCGPSVEPEEGSKGLEAEGDELKSKRRKGENRSNEAGISGEAVQDSQVVVQNSSDAEISGDGFRWRKYGQKVVKGNRYPRSYYRCTSLKCNVRKHVERASDDPSAFITTYEGRHNHDMPIKNHANPLSSNRDPQAPTTQDRPHD